MTSRHYTLGAAALLAAIGASASSALLPLPVREQQLTPSRPQLPRTPVDPADALRRRQFKKERKAEKVRLKGGIPGAKLYKKAQRGKL